MSSPRDTQEVLKINVCAMSDEQAEILAQLLSTTTSKKHFSTDQIKINDSLTIALSHSIIRRACSYSSHSHYYVCDTNKLLGEGSLGKVYPVIGEIKIINDMVIFQTTRIRAVKIEITDPEDVTRNSNNELVLLNDNEYQASSPNLHMKEPFLDENDAGVYTYLFMNHIMGVTFA